MYVIGTAGHVDHGKSTLVEALTGINPDRLAEEQRREMTIDLGFAWLTLPSGKVVSVVDVPGHERFIKNMLAGVGGIDAALLVIAADEGVMPQTAEHLHILDLLEIEHGIVVLAKRDLVDDEWLALVEEDIQQQLRGTSMHNAPLIPVSARTGDGLEELKLAIDAMLGHTPARSGEHGAPRLPVDRVFTVAGFGTVVTGTLLDGPLALGEEVAIMPAGLRARVRGLQTHGSKREHTEPGTRVAINLAGVAVEDVHRGDVVTLPGAITPTELVDLRLRLVADAPRGLAHTDSLELFVGAAEVPCHVALLDADELRPGGEAWVQLRLERPIAVTRGDRCILRVPSPSVTIGGGRVVDAHPRRHRRFRHDVIQSLETLRRGTPAELLAQAAAGEGPIEWAALVARSGLAAGAAGPALAAALADGTLVRLGAPAAPDGAARDDTLLMAHGDWARVAAATANALLRFHGRNPLRAGIPREELKSRLGIRSSRAFNEMLTALEAQGMVEVAEQVVRQAGFAPSPSQPQRAEAEKLLQAFGAQPFSPPAREVWEPLGADLLGYLIESGRLVRVSPDVLFSGEAYMKLVEWTTSLLDAGGELTVGVLRDQFATSRKYALAFLEHLDQRKITRRVGDLRVKY